MLQTLEEIEIADYKDIYLDNKLSMKSKIVQDTDGSKVLIISVFDTTLPNNQVYEISLNIDKIDNQTSKWLAMVLANSLAENIIKCKKNCTTQVRNTFNSFLKSFGAVKI